MPFSAKSGYIPRTFNDWLTMFIGKINEKYNMTYTVESFVGTNWYDILYPIIQANIEGDAEFADVWVKLTEFFDQVNARIYDPVVIPNGIVENFERAGLIAAIRAMTAATAGKIGVCIFADTGTQDIQAKIAQVMTDSIAAGIWSDGDKSAIAQMDNGQTIAWNWFEGTDVDTDLRLTIYYANKNGKSLPAADDIAADLRTKLIQRYRFGTPFSPDLMYQIATDAPYALKLKLEWSDNNGTAWSNEIRDTEFKEKLIFDNISVLFQAV